eukprot:1315239-Amphidinium_carterae.2
MSLHDNGKSRECIQLNAVLSSNCQHGVYMILLLFDPSREQLVGDRELFLLQRTVSYLDALPTSPKGTVVFFHGSVFTAKTWQAC